MLASTCSIAALNRAARERPVTAVDRLEPAAVDRHHRLGEQVQVSAERDELPTGGAYRCAVVFSEVRDRLEVRRQASRQPHYLNIALTPAKERRVKRWEHEAVLDAMQEQLDRAPKTMRIRRQTAEHPFGTIKAWMGATHFRRSSRR
jgi:hypothetical protein